MDVMCIGGPWHGEMVGVNEHVEYFTVPDEIEINIISNESANTSEDPVMNNEFGYKRERVRHGMMCGWERFIFVPAVMSNEEIDKLYKEHERIIIRL